MLENIDGLSRRIPHVTYSVSIGATDGRALRVLLVENDDHEAARSEAGLRERLVPT